MAIVYISIGYHGKVSDFKDKKLFIFRSSEEKEKTCQLLAYSIFFFLSLHNPAAGYEK